MSNVSRHGAAACSGSSPDPEVGSEGSLQEEVELLRYQLAEKASLIQSLTGLVNALEAVAPELVTAMKKQWLLIDYSGNGESLESHEGTL